MDFQKALDRESAKLALGVREIALEIVRQVFEADNEAQKVKPKRKPTPRDRKWPYKPPRRRPQRGTAKSTVQHERITTPHPSGGYIDVVVGDLWKRRDGDSLRHVLAVDDTHITVDSPKYHDGTRVKRSEFVKRYKRVG